MAIPENIYIYSGVNLWSYDDFCELWEYELMTTDLYIC